MSFRLRCCTGQTGTNRHLVEMTPSWNAPDCRGVTTASSRREYRARPLLCRPTKNLIDTRPGVRLADSPINHVTRGDQLLAPSLTISQL